MRTGTMRRRPAALLAPLVATALALAIACATNPATGKREFSLMSEAQEIALGQQSDADVQREMGLYKDEAWQQYVSTLGLELARASERPDLPWHFAVVDAPAVNAFALPGGFIYVTRGILPFLQDEAQLAGVLGHEIGHVTARHSAQQYSRATGATLGLALGSIFVPAARPFGQLAESGLGLLFLKYGRDDELQADALGVRYASRTGFDPAGIPGMLTTLGRIDETADNKGVPNWLATHPAPENRVQEIQDEVQQAKIAAPPTRQAERADFLRRVDGLIFGDNPEQGIVRGASFLHPDLLFRVDFPRGWEVNNGQSQVVAKQPDADVFMVLQLLTRPVGRTLEEVAVGSMQGAGFRVLGGGPTTVNGLDAFIGTYEGAAEDGSRIGVRAAHVSHNRNVFVLAGIAPGALFERAEPAITASLRSFGPLSRAEAEDIHPNRIDLYTAREGDTWDGIAERAGRGVVKPTTLAIMNGHDITDPPRPGERLKIVVGG